METVMVSVGRLFHAEYNPRKISKKDFEQIENSIKEFGFVQPLVVNQATDRFGVIVGGNQRFEVAKKLGMEEVPVVFVDIPDLKKEKELNLRLNANQGDWDFDILKTFDFDILKSVGFDSVEFKEILNPERGEKIVPEIQFTEELKEANNYIVLKFDNEIDWLQAQTVFDLKTAKALDSKEGFQKQGVGRVLDGAKALAMIKATV